MLPDEIKKYLFDIKTSILSIEDFLGTERNFKKYEENKMLRRAVEREFENIGEAMNSLHKLEPNIPISSIRHIIGMRNRVIHGYDKIDNSIIGGTIERHLPVLKNEVSSLLDE